MASPDRVMLLRALLGPRPTDDAVLYVACNSPSDSSEDPRGGWHQRTARTIEEAADALDARAESAEVYVATAWFRPGEGRKKGAVIAKRTICADIDDKVMPAKIPAERHRQSRTLASALPCTTVLVDSGGGFQPHLILPEGDRLEDFEDSQDGLRHVEILAIALRLYLEARAEEILGASVALDVTDGVERTWRAAPGFNMKALDGEKTLTADRSIWRPVRLVHPVHTSALSSVAPADISFLFPYVAWAEELWDARSRGASATHARLDRKKQGSAGAGVAVATEHEPYFDPSILSDSLRRHWPCHADDQSEHDWALCRELAKRGWSPSTASAAIRLRRSLLSDPADGAKGERFDYIETTVGRAYADVEQRRGTRDVPAYEPFPLHVLPEPIERFVVESARAMRCSPEAILLPLLTGLGCAIGNSRRIQIKSTWTEPSLLWTCVVMGSGLLKSPAQEQGLLPFRLRHAASIRDWKAALASHEIEMQRYELRLAAWKRDKNPDVAPPEKPEKPVPLRLIVSDTTIEALVPILEANPRGLMLVRDELGGWFKSHGAYKQGRGGDLQQWLSVFGARGLTVDRKGDDAVHFVEHAFVGICGGIQPGALRRILTREMFEVGGAARFLFAMPDAPARVWSDDEVSPTVLKALDRIVARLLNLELELCSDGSHQPVVMAFDAEAKAAWIPYFNAMGARQRQAGSDEDLGAALSKLEAYAARLALLFTLTSWGAGPAEDPPNFVDVSSLKSAIEACAWFEREVLRVYAMLDEGPEVAERRRLTKWIRDHGGCVTPREVQRGIRRYRGGKRTAEAALQDLVDHGYGWWFLRPPPATGGKPSRAFQLRDEGTPSGDGDTRSGRGPFVAGSGGRVSPGGGESAASQGTVGDEAAGGAPPAPEGAKLVEAVVLAVEGTLLSVDRLRTEPPAPRACPACRGMEFWASQWRERTCRRCHPPTPGAEVAP